MKRIRVMLTLLAVFSLAALQEIEALLYPPLQSVPTVKTVKLVEIKPGAAPVVLVEPQSKR